MAENKHVLQESTNVWESGGSKESTNQVKTPSTKQKKIQLRLHHLNIKVFDFTG